MSNIIRLPLEQAYNVREIGGYVGTQGISAWKCFLRGDDLSALSTSDIAYLKAYGVTSVLDLRSNQECLAQPDALLHESWITHYHISFMVGNVDNIMLNVDKDVQIDSFYITLLQEKEKVAHIMNTIADAPAGCMLFHCAGGKDRTGVLSMLLLSLLEVDKEDIMANYQMSHTNLRRNKKMMNIVLPEGMDASYMLSQPEYIETCVDYIKDNYGTAYAYLKACGVSESQIDKIKQKLQGQ